MISHKHKTEALIRKSDMYIRRVSYIESVQTNGQREKDGVDNNNWRTNTNVYTVTVDITHRNEIFLVQLRKKTSTTATV